MGVSHVGIARVLSNPFRHYGRVQWVFSPPGTLPTQRLQKFHQVQISLAFNQTMKDIIDLSIDAYRAHVANDIERRDQLLTLINTSEQNKDKWIAFFETIGETETNLPDSEKEKLVEIALREKYNIFNPDKNS